MLFDFISSIIGYGDKSTTNIIVKIDNLKDLDLAVTQVVNSENITLISIKSSSSITYDVIAKGLVFNKLHLKSNYFIFIDECDNENNLECSLIVLSNNINIKLFVLKLDNIEPQQIINNLIDFFKDKIV